MNLEVNSSSWNVLTGVSIFIAILALILSIVAIILYSTVPQPPTHTLKIVNINSNDKNPTFTPSNITFFITTPNAGSNNPGITISNIESKSLHGIYYMIYNKSAVDIKIFNQNKTLNTVISSQGIGIFVVLENGESHVVSI